MPTASTSNGVTTQARHGTSPSDWRTGCLRDPSARMAELRQSSQLFPCQARKRFGRSVHVKPNTSKRSALSRAFYFMTKAVLLPALILALTNRFAFAGSATWDLDPISGDWNTAANWTPATVPNGPTDVATFELSNQTAVLLSASTEVAALVFDPGAASYVISPKRGSVLTISDTGITNNSGQIQSFTTSVDNSGNFSQILFTNSAAAGSNTSFLNQGGGVQGAETDFFDTATADNAALTNQGGSVYGGFTRFSGSSTAGHSIITNLES